MISTRFLFFSILSVCLFFSSAAHCGEPVVVFLEFHTGADAPALISHTKECFTNSAVQWQSITLADFEAQKLAFNEEQVLLVPESESFPASAVGALDAYLKSGGKVLFVGGDRPFTNPAVRFEGRIITQKAYHEKLKAGPGRDLGIIQKDKQYHPHCYADISVTGSSAVFAGDEKSMKFHIGQHAGWETWAVSVPPVALLFDTRLLRVRARGDAPCLSLELTEEDGSRWIAVFEIKKEWDTCLIPQDAFRIWESPQRGRPGDRVRFENVRQAVIGIADSHTPGVISGMPYNFELQKIDSLPETQVAGDSFYPASFSLEGIAPCYKSYRLDGPVTIVAGEHRFDYPGSVISAIPRMGGLGITMERPWRFLPVAKAQNKAGGRAYPAWIMLHLDRQYKGAVVAGMGFSLDTILKEKELSVIMVNLVKRVAAGSFLAGGGASDFVVDAGIPFPFGAEPFKVRGNMKIQASIRNTEGGVVAEFEKTISEQNMEHGAVISETTLNQAGVYRCTVELKDAQNRTHDKIESEIIVDDGTPDPPSAFVRIEKDNFVIGGKPWYPSGVNFYPIYGVAGMESNDFQTGWGNRRFYDPVLVEEAILDAKSAEMNMLSVHPSDFRTLDFRAIRDLLYRCRKHEMKLNLFASAASPLQFREDLLRQLIEEARLRHHASLFCYDIIWEPTNYIYSPNFRERFRPEWNRWLEGQYGSKENAVKDWMFEPGTDEKGLLAPPSDAQFSQDGGHRVFVAAYRRFMDDHTAKLWQRAVDQLRLLDPNHLITNRAGNIHPYDNGFTGPVKALDFISPEGYSISPGTKGEAAVGFAVRVIDFYSGGKPIVWSEFGKSVSGADFQPVASLLKQSGEYIEQFYRRGLEAGAQGFVPWWWPGGYRVNENSDYGICNLDGTLRQSAEVAQRYADQIQKPRNRRAGTVPFDFDPDEHAGGYPGLVFGKGGEAYLDAAGKGEMLLFRTEADGKTSVDVPLKGIGNVPYTGNNPVKYLNGIFEKVEYRDSAGHWIEMTDSTIIRHRGPLELRVRIANMGLVPFVATTGTGGVAVYATLGEQVLRFPIQSDLPRLQDTTLTDIIIPAQWKGTLSLRFEAKERAVFGDEFRFGIEEN